ncbi:MAG: hypothetical protein ING03_12035 [Roseomonas sp.]|nr:hypothetical protein [Roseomonas sp.]MCA3651698.1 hypothetical protein [Methylobacterium sp.]
MNAPGEDAARVKETTAKSYRRLIERAILPALGRHRVSDIGSHPPPLPPSRDYP